MTLCYRGIRYVPSNVRSAVACPEMKYRGIEYRKS
ncbi:MAG: DUF4278 domain-containing protein [Microcoleaceae cyanobacterium]